MRSIFLTIIVFVALLPIQPVTAEENATAVKRFRVLLTTGQRFEGSDAVLNSDGLRGICSDTTVYFKRESIRRLQRRSGTKVWDGLAIGAAAGLGLLYFGSHSEGLDTISSADRNRAWVVLGLAGAAVSIGIVVGLMTDAWQEMPLETAIHFEPADNRVGLSLSLSF